MPVDFKKIADNAIKQGITPDNSIASREWFRAAAARTSNISPENVLNNPEPFELIQRLSMQSIGKLYLFRYDPKTKDKLPYYDIFPLVFPVEYYSDSFLGINLHYLPLPYRAKLMNGLYELINNNKMDSTTQLKMSYKILKSMSSLKYFQPCLKRYLINHVASKFLYVKPIYWDMALFLPLERFQKKSSSQVYSESIKKVR